LIPHNVGANEKEKELHGSIAMVFNFNFLIKKLIIILLKN